MDLGYWQASLFFCVLRTGDLERARLVAPTGWKEFCMVAWRFFLMQSDLNDELKDRLAQELLNAIEQPAEPPESNDGGSTIVGSQPFIFALLLILVNPDKVDDEVLPLTPGLIPPSHSDPDSAKDGENWWLLMPLTLPDADDSPNVQWSDDEFVQGVIGRLSTDRPWIFNWFGYSRTILLRLEMTWVPHPRKWVVCRCDYVGMRNLNSVENERITASSGLSEFIPVQFFKACKEDSCQRQLLSRLILMGKLGIDGTLNLYARKLETIEY
ncbi:hypothetical protein FGADI_13155 [Fusarium gaditjirri]|uniref:Uncharacterized protein n=1 Tax=Fusarium gaditjirri TaxID=282569 RepID=A0A8H4SQC7_9HYPO|nr:hypothetical protein FGADI_13155 [Fusarium gaditjirri]